MPQFPRVWLVIGVVAAVIMAVAAFIVLEKPADIPAPAKPDLPQTVTAPTATSPSTTPTATTAPAPGPAGPPLVAAPAKDSQAPLPATQAEIIGTVQPVRGDLNPQVESVVAALKDRSHSERLSAMVAPPPYDPAAFKADPQKYANVVEPGRVYQSAQPAENVPVLSPLGPTQLSVAQDAQIFLRVRTQPNAPTTFTSFDLGRFGNSLTSQTVIADANGVAAVAFTPGRGTIDAVHVLAGSPMASGQVLFDINATAAGAQRPATVRNPL